jgi:hypothetical protein
MELIIEKLKKIKELVERGVDGEAKAAREKLHILLNKYNLSIEDLEDNKVSSYKFKYVTSAELDIIIQCISKVTDNPKQVYSYYKDKKKEVFVKLTEWQYIEATVLVKFHVALFRKELKSHLKALVSAYCSKHHLFADSSTGEGGVEMTEEEIMKYLKIYRSLDDKSFQKQIDK